MNEQIKLKVLHIPGHTPGSISLLVDGYVLTGDTLLAEGPGRTDLEGASPVDLIRAVEEILLPPEESLILLPGHGPASTIGEVKRAYQLSWKT